MASRATKPASGSFDLPALIKAKVAEADADPRPRIPMEQVFADLRAHHAKRIARES
jgi:antitoxin ParD1/3/4